jgi:twitching motility two-component system response regulator PilG
LKIRAGARKGYLHFQDGALIDAETGTMTGEPAALRILAWDDIKIVVMGECRDRKPVITRSNFHLIMEASRLKDEGLLDEETQSAVEKAIMHAEAHQHREAMDILAQQLKKNPRNGVAWLWYSRCLGRMDAIESALKKAYASSPDDPDVQSDLQMFQSAKGNAQASQVKRCPICWAPLVVQDIRCHFCQAHLFVPKSPLAEPFSASRMKIYEKAAERYERVCKREATANVRFFLGIAHLNLHRYEDALDALVLAVGADPESPLFKEQLRLLRQHMTAMSAAEAKPLKAWSNG